ncbi:hypothetical protein E2I00_011409 [Balaenoptera physalus]|uniref:Apolipoprotein A-V n=1 Tax=Balaenoptera physalus TaxID=9770 RepID=A0A6A1QJQ0_BALPH|nr:hypothetical protein E2I00_011409 [Balaenoptera physalus]
MASVAAVLTWALALLSVLSITQARKGFWDYFSQSSRDKGRVEQIQQQKLAREPASLKDRLEPDLSNMDNFLEKLGPLNGQGREPPGLPRDPVGMRQQLQDELEEEVRQRLQAFRHDTFLQIAAFTRAIDQETKQIQQQLAPPPPGHSAFAPEFLQGDGGKARSELQARLDDLWEDINYSLRDHSPGHLGEP